MDKTYEFNANGLVTKEIGAGYQVAVTMKEWNGTRYYVTRDNKKIGWIATDFSKVEGTTSTHTLWLNQMIKAIKAGK
jgi:hypothetical protein